MEKFSEEEKQNIVAEFLPKIKSWTIRLKGTLPDSVEVDDLFSTASNFSNIFTLLFYFAVGIILHFNGLFNREFFTFESILYFGTILRIMIKRYIVS